MVAAALVPRDGLPAARVRGGAGGWVKRHTRGPPRGRGRKRRTTRLLIREATEQWLGGRGGFSDVVLDQAGGRVRGGCSVRLCGGRRCQRRCRVLQAARGGANAGRLAAAFFSGSLLAIPPLCRCAPSGSRASCVTRSTAVAVVRAVRVLEKLRRADVVRLWLTSSARRRAALGTALTAQGARRMAPLCCGACAGPRAGTRHGTRCALQARLYLCSAAS